MENKLPYNSYSDYLINTFGEKVYKLPIKLSLTCPNRDGTCGTGGCIFCGDDGGSFENLENMSISKQIDMNKAYIQKRYKAKKFISYFQNFTNTYLEFNDFQSNMYESLKEDIVGVNISTRPDCLPDPHLNLLEEINKNYQVTLELGLQTVNYKTLKILNRGHLLSDFIDAVLKAKKRNLRICTHIILDLPWDEEIDVIETAKILNVLGVDEVKLHSLYIVKGTKLASMYKRNEFEPLSLEEYKKRVILFLQHLKPNVVLQRIVGRAPAENTIFCNHSTSWWKIRDEIVQYMNENDLYQGKLIELKG